MQQIMCRNVYHWLFVSHRENKQTEELQSSGAPELELYGNILYITILETVLKKKLPNNCALQTNIENVCDYLPSSKATPKAFMMDCLL